MSAGRRLLAVADALPVTVLAVIAGAGSFTHIRDTAAEHGQGGPMSWAVAVCIDLTCVMAARERQRDKQHGIVARRLSWPAVVLAGGVLLSLAANLAQAQPTAWGRIVAAVPPAAFLVAVSMIERRAARRPRLVAGEDGAPASRPRRDGRPRCRLPGTRPRTAGTRRSWRPRGGPPPSTRTGTGSRSPATRSAPASACPTRPPPSCCASSAPARACRREPPAPPDPGRLPAPAGAPGPRRAGRRAGGSTGTAKAWQPTGTGSAGHGSRPAPARPVRGLPAAGAEGLRPGARDSGPDGQQN